MRDILCDGISDDYAIRYDARWCDAWYIMCHMSRVPRHTILDLHHMSYGMRAQCMLHAAVFTHVETPTHTPLSALSRIASNWGFPRLGLVRLVMWMSVHRTSLTQPSLGNSRDHSMSYGKRRHDIMTSAMWRFVHRPANGYSATGATERAPERPSKGS